MFKTILFTHDDLDGAGSRIVYELAHQHLKKGKEYDVINCSNSGINNDVMRLLLEGNITKDTEICFADIVPSNDTLEYIVNNFNVPRIWDHHKTAVGCTKIVPTANIVIENNLGVKQSGTSLIYQHYRELEVDFPNDPRVKFLDYNYGARELLEKFVDTIRSYDTYEWKTTNNIEAKRLQVLFSLLGMDQFCKQYIYLLSDYHNDAIYDELIIGKDNKFIDAKLEREQKIIDSVTPSDIYPINVRGYNTAFSLGNMGVNGSELAHQFLTKYPEFDAFCILDFFNGGATLQFRSVKEGIDVATEFAVPIGGGGHAKASGAPLPHDVKYNIINIVLDHLNS